MIFQELVYVPGLTVAENLCLGHHPTTKLGLVDWKKINREAQELLDREGIHVKATTVMADDMEKICGKCNDFFRYRAYFSVPASTSAGSSSRKPAESFRREMGFGI